MLLNNSATIEWVTSHPRFHSWQKWNKDYCDDDDVLLRVWQCLITDSMFPFCLFICLVLNRLSVPPAQHWTLEQKLRIKRRPAVQRRRNVAEGSRASRPSKHIIRALSCRRRTLYDSFQTDLTAVVPLIDRIWHHQSWLAFQCLGERMEHVFQVLKCHKN